MVSRNHTYCHSQTNEHQCTLTVKANISISSEEPSRETRFSTLLSNSLLQYIMKPLTGKWKRCNHGVRLAEDDRHEPIQPQICRHSSHQRRTRTHDHHARRSHHSHDGTQRAPSPHENVSNVTSKRGRGNKVAVQGMNIEIPPPEGRNKHLGQLMTFKHAVKVEFEHRTACALETFTSQAGVDVNKKYPLRHRLELFDAAATHHSSTHQERGR